MDGAAVRRRGLLALAAVAALAAPVALAARGERPGKTPPSWKPLGADLPPGVGVWRSADRRCAVAAVSAPGEGLEAAEVAAALRAELAGAGVKLAEGDEPLALAHGDVRGSLRLREIASGRGPWQLQACFYHERDAHVCQSVCQQMLR